MSNMATFKQLKDSGYKGFGSFSIKKHGMNKVEIIGNIHENPELLK